MKMPYNSGISKISDTVRGDKNLKMKKHQLKTNPQFYQPEDNDSMGEDEAPIVYEK